MHLVRSPVWVLAWMLVACGDGSDPDAPALEDARREWDAARRTGDVGLQCRVGAALLERDRLPRTEWGDLLDAAVATGDRERVATIADRLVVRGSAADPTVARAWLDLAHAATLGGRHAAFLDRLWERLAADRDLAVSGTATRALGAALELAFALGEEAALERALTERTGREPDGRGALFAQLAALAHGDRAAVLADPRLATNPVSAAEWAGMDGRWDEARARFGALLEGAAPEHDLRLRRLLLRLDVLRGAEVEAERAEALGLQERTFLLRSRGAHDEALRRLAAAGRERSPEALQVLREAGRFDAALELVDALAADVPPPLAARLAQTRRRIELEAGRVPGAPPAAVATAPVEDALWAAVAALLDGERDAARAHVERAHAAFPSGDAEREAWITVQFLRAPPARRARPVALDWTRFPRQRDNDQLFFAGLRHVLDGEAARARQAFEAARDATLGREFPWHLIQVALERLAAREEGR